MDHSSWSTVRASSVPVRKIQALRWTVAVSVSGVSLFVLLVDANMRACASKKGDGEIKPVLTESVRHAQIPHRNEILNGPVEEYLCGQVVHFQLV